jgi:hypothetical protein
MLYFIQIFVYNLFCFFFLIPYCFFDNFLNLSSVETWQQVYNIAKRIAFSHQLDSKSKTLNIIYFFIKLTFQDSGNKNLSNFKIAKEIKI